MRFPYIALLSACALTLASPLLAQSPNGVINGLVVDPSNRMIVAAEIVAVNDVTGVHHTTKTNNEGIYVLPNLPPGPYRLQASKVGFKAIIKPDIVLNVQDALSINFTLPVGAFYETVTVEGGAPLVNTQDASVSTVVDRQFAENLPMNGRSFQTLIQLSPGVVLTATNTQDTGQFSVNGQRATSNYWMVDGVGANIGMGGIIAGNGMGGAVGSFSALGGTNSLVSVDAMQEFRITLTYAPEFGRTPGGQISIVTRSGTNRFHGTAFDYLRNDIFDANNWFNTAVTPALPKAEERQNDFGGTLSGPILKQKTFFFFSYEGLRLRLPETTLTLVPDLASRLNATQYMRPYLSAFPKPNGPEMGQGLAAFSASYSNPATLDAYSIRVDHRLNDKWTLFGRFSYSPSGVVQRGLSGTTLNTLSPNTVATQTLTVGSTWTASATLSNDLRVNYSRTNSRSALELDSFGGAAQLSSLPLPSPFTDRNSNLFFDILSLGNNLGFGDGKFGHNLQRQLNIVDSVSLQKGSHSLKVGVDFRRLSPFFDPAQYSQQAVFLDVPSAQAGDAFLSEIAVERRATFLFRNLGAYAQDTWRIVPHLVVTYGIRWDVDFVPRSLDGPDLPAITGFNLNDLSRLALAPAGMPAYSTGYANLAPRFGIAYQLSSNSEWQRVIRGGFGVFYDLATSEIGNNGLYAYAYPFGASIFCPNPAIAACPTGGLTFPFSQTAAAPPPISAPNAGNGGTLYGVDPHLELPRILEWNVALEQALGHQQKISASYIGASGKRLIQTAAVTSPNPNLLRAQLVTNAGTSEYDALQVQFQRRLANGLQILGSYTWSHSIDDGSAGSGAIASNSFVRSAIGSNRGPSDFDIRNSFTAGLTYEIPSPKASAIGKVILGGWSTENFLTIRTAPPVDISDSNYFLSEFAGGISGDIRPDLVPGKPLYLYGSQYPGGKAFNGTAFTDVPPAANNSTVPLRQGNVPRNFLRGFAATQWDCAIHRDFPVHESVRLQFRAEMFNVLNHPNFGPPSGRFGTSTFGLSTQMLGQSLAGGNAGSGSLSPLYQIGGPRSIQLALKLMF